MKFNIAGLTISTQGGDPQPRRFGLEQAKSAARHASKPPIQAMLAIAEELGFENTVAAEVAQAASKIRAEVEMSQAGIDENTARISALQSSNASLQREIDVAVRNEAELEKIRERFAVTGGK